MVLVEGSEAKLDAESVELGLGGEAFSFAPA